MFKKSSPRRATPRYLQEPAMEENILISELEKSLENLKQAIRQGEITAGKITAALGGNNDD